MNISLIQLQKYKNKIKPKSVIRFYVRVTFIMCRLLSVLSKA